MMMSKIFDALKEAELARAKRESYEPARKTLPNRAERRRARRINAEIPIFVYGYTRRNAPFCEEACTITINAHGGLISMRTAVQPGQRLLVTNEGNESTQECVVVSVGSLLARHVPVAFEFAGPVPQFWRNLEIGKGLGL